MVFAKIKAIIHAVVIVLIILPATPMIAIALPAFPGAMGWGSDTIGGRSASAKLYKVNTLSNDSSGSCSGNICTGSLRYALTASGPRIVIFTTGGTIALNSPIQIFNGYLTVAGQTAPGGGIQIRNHGIEIITSDVIIRGLRIRVGDANHSPGIIVHGGGSSRRNIVIDHNSISWSRDEQLTLWQHPDFIFNNITLSWNVFSEGLTSGDGHGILIGDGLSFSNPSFNISIHHNLFVHDPDRVPLLKGSVLAEVINNVAYNWYWHPFHTMTKTSFIGNHYIKGPNTTSGDWFVNISNSDYTEPLPNNSVYLSNNIGPGRPTNTGDEWNAVYGGPSGPYARYRSNTPPFTLSNVVVDDVSTLLPKILSGAGATAPSRDSVDTRLVNDVTNRTGGHIASQTQVGGWPNLAAGTYPTDTDGDGMPDSWETARGLNPNDPSDWNKNRDGNGYLNIEEYINSLFPAIVSHITPQSALIPNPPSIIGIK